MGETRTSLFEQFMILFNAVKEAAANEPERINTFFGQHEKITSAVNALCTFLMVSDLKRRAFHSSKKYHQQVPDGFEEAYKEFELGWEARVVEASLNSIIEKFGLERPTSEPSERGGIPSPQYRSPDPGLDENFSPTLHDGGKAFEFVLLAAGAKFENITENGEGEWIDYASKIGLEAYDYLTETIGIDVDGIFRRWRAVPTIFMPAHVSNSYGLEEAGTLYDLIDDAVRAYVSGAPAAAMAMCRACLEMVLKRHYGLEYQFRDNKGRLRDKGLGELIILADEKYKFVEGKRLRKLADDANRVLHNYSRRTRMSETDEGIILDFLKTVKFLIQRAPEK